MDVFADRRIGRRGTILAGAFLALVVLGLAAHGMRAFREDPAVGEFGGVSLRLEFATTSAAREQGLSGRANVPDGYGMLFAFKDSKEYGFWMRDMQVPIDIFWLDDKGQVVTIATEVTPESYPRVFYPTEAARYVLETAAGFAAAHGVSTGTALHLKKFPSVSD